MVMVTSFLSAVFCGEVEHVEHGSIAVAGQQYGSMATVTCDSDYQILGNATLVCMADGQWSYPAPLCLPSGKGSQNFFTPDVLVLHLLKSLTALLGGVSVILCVF